MNTKWNIFKLSWRLLFGALVTIELLTFLRIIPLSPTYTILGLLITALFTWLVVEIIQFVFEAFGTHNLYRWQMTLLLVAVVYLDAIGDFFNFYTTIPNYDGFLHFFTPAVGTWWIWQLLQILYPSCAQSFRILATATTTLSLASLYEIEEYLEDWLTGSHRLGDSFDTGNDLFMALVGTILMLLIITLYLAGNKKNRPLANS